MSTTLIPSNPLDLPRAVISGRREACRLCPTPCELRISDRHAIAAQSCPLPEPRWRPWREVHQKQQPPARGLGDLAKVVAQPVAKAVDAVAGTDLQNCPGCAARQVRWNQAGDKLAAAAKSAFARVKGALGTPPS